MLKNLRVININNKIIPTNINENLNYIKNAILFSQEQNADIICFPKNTFKGSVFYEGKVNNTIIEFEKAAFENILDFSKKINSLITLGTNRDNINGVSVIYKGQELVFLENNKMKTIVFDNFSILFTNTSLEDSILNSNKFKNENVDILVLIDNQDYTIKTKNQTKNILKVLNKVTKSSISYVSGFIGDSSTKSYKKAFSLFVEGNKVEKEHSSNPQNIYDDFLYLIYDFDKEIIIKEENKLNTEKMVINKKLNEKINCNRNICKDPFYRYFETFDKSFLLNMFYMQVESLAKRLTNINCKKVVLPLSGGIDSTLALMICHEALKVLKLSSKNIITITLPGFGTSKSTYNIAVKLSEFFETDFREISIKNSVIQHFKDINHDENIKDVVYENAQSRERTQIALDLANKHQAITIGTGDLSEEALGFCTFGGDHLANFNVNVCFTKTMIKQLFKIFIFENRYESINNIINNILENPISPELLPTSQDGSIEQKTEEILGDYIIHEFFLFYLLKYNMSFEKIIYYANIAFKKEYSQDFIKQKFNLFINKYYKNQFKRNCQPDSVSITDINFTNPKFYLESDLNVNYLLK